MASLEIIRFRQHRADVPNVINPSNVSWHESECRSSELPVIIWANSESWGQANLWAEHLADQLDPQTVMTSMKHLASYAQWLESENIDWWHFPERKSERCLFKYRKALIEARDFHVIAPSTASARMAAVLRFYRWAYSTELLTVNGFMWEDHQASIKYVTSFGLERTMRVTSSELKIPNRKVKGGFYLEDGLLPVTDEGRHNILSFTNSHASDEFSLMLALGFGSGLRLSTICDLKISTIKHATIDPTTSWRRIDIGPAAHPPVKTKFNISGKVPIWNELHARILEYSASSRRLKRQIKADPENHDLLFLNRNGKPYTPGSITTEMCRLREKALKADIQVFRDFHFHRSRATFATLLMRIALQVLPVNQAIDLVRESCLHANVKSTMGYVKFIEHSKAMKENADAFTEAFFGLTQQVKNHA